MQPRPGNTLLRSPSACNTLSPAKEARRLALNFFPAAHSIDDFVNAINASLAAHVAPIVLRYESDAQYPAYIRLIDQVLVAWPAPVSPAPGQQAPAVVPDDVAEGLTTPRGAVPHDDVISRVISSTLRKYPRAFDACEKNVLCNGFDLGRPNGPGSVFRNLDARDVSGSVHLLRSPPWRRFFERIGHVAARHLLSNAALLIPVASPNSTGNAGASLSLLQLCGPLLRTSSMRYSKGLPHSALVLKRDVLYRDSSEICSKRVMQSEKRGSRLLNSGLPSSHPLQRLKHDNYQSVDELFMLMFPSYKKKLEGAHRDAVSAVHYRSRKRRRVQSASSSNGLLTNQSRNRCAVPKRLDALVPILKNLLHRVSKRSFRCLLAESCPLTLPDRQSTGQSAIPPQVISLASKPSDVARFLLRVCRQTIPLDMFGTERNRSLFERSVRELICRRAEYESFDFCQYFACQGLRVSEVPWLQLSRSRNPSRICNPTDLRFRQTRLNEFISWVFRGFCLPLLRHNFAASECSTFLHRIMYFRREVWVSLTDATFRLMMKSDRHQFTPMSKAMLASAVRQRHRLLNTRGSLLGQQSVFALSHMRFQPKSSGARGIQRPRYVLLRSFGAGVAECRRLRLASSSPWDGSGRFAASRAQFAMKSFYANALAIFRSESDRYPKVLGASVFSNDQIYKKYLQTVQNWRTAGCPRMFFVCMDITKSFDNIPLDTLLDNVIPSLLRRDRYVVLRYAVCRRLPGTERTVCRFRNYVCEEPGDESHFPRLVRSKLASKHRGAILIELVSKSVFTKHDLLITLREMLSNNIITIPRRVRSRSSTGYALQCQGLPQGCVISSILTCLFYGFVENSDLESFLTRDNENLRALGSPMLFMRQVDDTLFACSSKSISQSFAVRMNKGWDDTHGFVINEDKTRASFEIATKGRTSLRLIPWCGYVIDTATMEVFGDYARFAGTRIRDRLSIVFGPGAQDALYRHAASCFLPKLHPMLLDPKINSSRTIALNVYQCALFCSMKLCSYASVLYPKREDGADPNTSRLFESIVMHMSTQFGYLVTHATRRIPNVSPDKLSIQELEPALASDVVKFLATHALLRVISQHLDVWYSLRAKATLRAAQSNLQFKRQHGRTVDLHEVYEVVLRDASSASILSLRL